MTSDAEEIERARALLDAQQRAEALFEAIGDAGIVAAGVSETEASDAIAVLAKDLFGVERHWHKRIVRAGPNTVLTFAQSGPEQVIGDDDIVYADLGPVFHGWEADYGRTWVVGEDPDRLRLRDDLDDVFRAGRNHFERHPDISAAELYRHVVALAEQRGWGFGNDHCGHLVGEFPHERFPGERSASYITEANTEPLRRVDPSGHDAHWILEVHLVDPDRRYGGFVEQLLTV